MTIQHLHPPSVSILERNSCHLQNPMFPCQDFREGQSQKTLAYAQALQYGAEKSNPPMLGQPHLLVRCILELRRVMEPYVVFSDDAVLKGATPWERSLEGQTQATIPVKTQLAPIEEPTEEPAPAESSSQEAAPTEVSMEEVHPTEVPTKEAAPTEECTEELAPAEASTEEVAPLEVSPEEADPIEGAHQRTSYPNGHHWWASKGAKYPPHAMQGERKGSSASW